ncbi:hypothetical protein LUZ60_009785 [Juncus effusus]|nr:hypothetical protein LUZ60_009785 [Juncus effusus]
MDALSALALPPGFGFHPTDVELISHYLKKKINGLKIDYDVIPEIDIYKHEPWDLPSKCKVPTKDTKWHFFASRDRKYPNGARSNRATEAGYWKSTGKDRNIKLKNKIIGTKKTLVFHEGRPPSGKRTDWIMHEYYLDDNDSKNNPDLKDLYVLCRVTKRDGFGTEADVSVPQQEVKIETEQSNVVTEPVVTDDLSSPSEINNNINNEENNNEENFDIWWSNIFADPNALPILDEQNGELLVGPTQMAPKQEPVYFSPGEGSEDENPFLLLEDLQGILGNYNFPNTENLQFLENDTITNYGNANSTFYNEDNETGIVIRQRVNNDDNFNEMQNINKYNLNCKLQVNLCKKEATSVEKSNQFVQFAPKGGLVGEVDNSEKIKGGNGNIVSSKSYRRKLFGINPLMFGALLIGGIGIMICYALSKRNVLSSVGL